MELSAVVSTETGDLELEDPGAYRIITWGAGPVLWRRETVASPFVHGSTLVRAVKENPVMVLSVLVEGSDSEDLAEKTATLLRAFEQFRYTLNVTVNDTEYEWVCQPADYTSNQDGTFRRDHWSQFVQIYNFRIPREPIPVQGTH